MAKKEKMIVAVHGIGDQTSYETIQAVGRQFFRAKEFVGAVPLGWYYGDLKRDSQDQHAKGFLRYRTICPKRDQRNEPNCHACGFESQYGCFSFSEVYWAGIPRVPERSGYIVEETKNWAKTLVERLHAHQRKRPENETQGLNLSHRNYKAIKQVLVEMIQTVSILERLVGWLENHTKFRFPLKNILNDYLADVQIVTDFRPYRNSILEEFRSVMQAVHEGNRDGEIYIIAHSEGTVVTLLGLLKGLATQAGDTANDWIKQVKGLMTIGSPIDKHLLLWPELWDEFEGITWRKLSAPITWCNYYDYGDPVGFELDSARLWLEEIGAPLQLTPENDVGFSRYVFPGKAHNDYWRDDKVFLHFIQNVILKETKAEKPPTKWYVPFLSAVIPYLLVTVLCGIGTYLIYKATAVVIHGPVVSAAIAGDVALLGLSLACATASARIPRLARKTWAFAAAAGLSAFAVLFIFFLSKEFMLVVADKIRIDEGIAWAIPAGIAVAISAVGWISGVNRPKLGMFPMLGTGTIGIGFLVYKIAADSPIGELWPVVIAGIGFLYFWWLAALVFDLSFIWHRYICMNAGMEKMARIATGRIRPRRQLLTRKAVVQPTVEASA